MLVLNDHFDLNNVKTKSNLTKLLIIPNAILQALVTVSDSFNL